MIFEEVRFLIGTALGSLRLRRSFIESLHDRMFHSGRTRYNSSYVSHIPDRYAATGQDHRLRRNSVANDLIHKFTVGSEFNNSGDLPRLFFLAMACDLVVQEKIAGDIAELGVFRGNTAVILSRLAENNQSTVFLFDTFSGFSEDDLDGVDRDRKMEFEDVDLEAVKGFVASNNAVFVPGYFPDSIEGKVPDDQKYCLVHIDCDLYKPFAAALSYFYPRLQPGGFLIMHDYMSLHWEGVEQAVNEFFADKPESIIPIPDKSGTVVIRKTKGDIG